MDDLKKLAEEVLERDGKIYSGYTAPELLRKLMAAQTDAAPILAREILRLLGENKHDITSNKRQEGIPF